MIPVRHFWALPALAITLILSACSSPEDLVSPTLEPQFGTTDNDFGVDVAYTPNGQVFVLSGQKGLYDIEDGDYYDEGYENIVILSRYDTSGRLIWSKGISYDYCSYYGNCDSNSLQIRSITTDPKGYSYSLVTSRYDSSDCATSSSHHVLKHDASGNRIRSISVGTSGDFLGGSRAPAPDFAVDGSGNLYVVRQEASFDDTYCFAGGSNVVAKYSATGSLVWQRLSPVGTLYGVSVSSNGYVYVAGSNGVARYTNSGNLTWTKSGDTRDITTVGTNTVYARNLTTVRKLDATGKQLWSKAQTGLSGLVMVDMTADTNGNVYLTGKYSASSSDRNVFTRKLKSSGSTVFTKTFGTSAYDDARGIATINGSEIYLTGATQGSLAHSFRGDENDGYVRKLNSSGNPVWMR